MNDVKNNLIGAVVALGLLSLLAFFIITMFRIDADKYKARMAVHRSQYELCIASIDNMNNSTRYANVSADRCAGLSNIRPPDSPVKPSVYSQ